MKIHIADPTGLCFGVRRAISKLEEELLRSGTVYSLGSPIHNPQETHRLTGMGLVVVESAEEVPAGSVAFIRAHGVTPLQADILMKKCRKVVDGTCPFVKTAQKRAKDLSSEGYVEGEVAVVSSEEGIPDNLKGRRCGILSQTTQKVGSFAALVGSFIKVSPEIKVYNTICKATLARQDSVCRLASKVDGMIILGGRNSANTKKLAEISMDVGVSTLWIEHAGEIDRGWLQNRDDIGIAAGGSTPDWLIKELIQKLNMM